MGLTFYHCYYNLYYRLNFLAEIIKGLKLYYSGLALHYLSNINKLLLMQPKANMKCSFIAQAPRLDSSLRLATHL